MVVQHNIPALNSHRQLGVNNANTAKNLEKLSSGFKINRAGDDAAGLAISEKMRGQIRGLAMAEQNVANGISLIQTAEGGLNETHDILQRMRELAVQSANGTYDNEVDRFNLNKELDALKSEIDRISTSTHYNGINLLDGSIGFGAAGDAGTAGAELSNVAQFIDTATFAYTAATAGTGATPGGPPSNLAEIYIDEISISNNGTDITAKFVDATGKAYTATGSTATVAGVTTVTLEIGGTGGTAGTGGTPAPGDDAKIVFNLAADVKDGVIKNVGMFDGSANIAAGNDVLTDALGSARTFVGDYKGLTFQIGANGVEDQKVRLLVGNMDSRHIGIADAYDTTTGAITAHGTKIADISIATQDEASEAIKVITAATNMVSSTRSDLGALQNRLEHTSNNLGVTKENLTAAESTIRDVDMAKEMMDFQKNQILVQASQAMLAQANSLPQGVLQLLR